jgi:methyl-accepting chemotaxis protein
MRAPSSIRTRLVIAGAAAILVTTSVLITASVVESQSFLDVATGQSRKQSTDQLQLAAQGVMDIVNTQGDSVQEGTDSQHVMMQRLIALQGGITMSTDTQHWQVVNQVDKSTKAIDLPIMLLGGQPIPKVMDPKAPVPIVDDATTVFPHTTSTIFQRIDDQGSMMRLATSGVGADGQRITGTYIPPTNADGTPNKLIAALLAGQKYSGVSLVGDKWMVTEYEPLVVDGKLVGAVGNGKAEQSISTLRDAIVGTKVGAGGGVAVLGASGVTKGVYQLNADASLEGKSALDAKDADGQAYIQQVLDVAKGLKDGELGTVHYRESDTGNAVTARVGYYAPWDWVVVTHADDRDFDFSGPLVSGRHNMVRTLVIAGLLVAIAGAALALWYARRMTKPITAVATALEGVATGDLSQDVDHHSRDEVGQMAASLNRAVGSMREITDALTAVAAGQLDVDVTMRGEHDMLGHAAQDLLEAQRERARQAAEMANMTQRLSLLLERVAEYSTSIAGSSGELRGISEQMAATAEETSVQALVVSQASNDVRSHNSALGAAVDEIRTGIGEVARNAHQASMVADQAVAVAGEANDTASRLAASSAEIDTIVETIGSIAEETNLLALNATIEAARAGESGKGFAVVAHEVKELASETTRATSEIRHTIERLQQDTRAVIDAIGRIGTIISTISEAQQSIASVVEEQTAAASEVVRNVTDVTAAGEQIADNIEGVASAANSTAAGATETEASAAELARVANELQDLILEFRNRRDGDAAPAPAAAPARHAARV